MKNQFLNNFSKEELVELIEIYSKNWLAMDGLWFQSVEKNFGMTEAMKSNCSVWGIFSKAEAKRIKEFLSLGDNSGIEGLRKALALRLYANINDDETLVNGNELVYRVLDCRVQNARKRKGMEFHPCKEVGLIEYEVFAKEIDSRFDFECISCYPEITDESCNCAWKFTLKE